MSGITTISRDREKDLDSLRLQSRVPCARYALGGIVRGIYYCRQCGHPRLEHGVKETTTSNNTERLAGLGRTIGTRKASK